MYDNAWIICFFHLDTLTHLNALFHRWVNREKTQRQSEQVESFRCIWYEGRHHDKKNLATEKRSYSLLTTLRHWSSSIWYLGEWEFHQLSSPSCSSTHLRSEPTFYRYLLFSLSIVPLNTWNYLLLLLLFVHVRYLPDSLALPYSLALPFYAA
jgi:hypothetical protein